MSTVQTRPRPAGTGREVDTALQAVSKAYHGATPASIVPTPRHPLTVARELRSAAECLEGIAEDFAAGAIDERELSAVDRMLVGMGRLIMELRMRQGATS
jgi:hypothetical protein